MAGINPATGKFDPYYNSGAGIPAGDVQSRTNKAGVTTFTNTTWKVSGPISSSPGAPLPTGGSDPAPAPAPGPSAEDIYWGLSSLYGKVVEYARKGYNGDAIAVMLRSTPEYKARFPAMEALAKKGRAISEGQYIDYERTAAQIEQRYGITTGMVTGNVTKLLTEEVSAAELNDRVVLAGLLEH
jgi:hypothetical protein